MFTLGLVNTPCLPFQAMRLIHKKNPKKLIDNLHLVNWFFSKRQGFFGLKSVLKVLSPRLQNFIISQIFEIER